MSITISEVTGDGVRKTKLWKKLLGVEHVVLKDSDVEAVPGGELAVVRLRLDQRHRLRCPECGKKTTAIRR
jgi:hypothetical protein